MMSWSVTRGHNGFLIGKFSNRGPFVDGPAKIVIDLLLREVSKDILVGENPQHADTIVNLFTEAGG